MKTIITLFLTVILCSCSTRVDDTIDAYIDYDVSKISKDSVQIASKREIFKKKALMLNSKDLGELDRRIKEYQGEQAYRQKEWDVRRSMINDILEFDKNNNH